MKPAKLVAIAVAVLFGAAAARAGEVTVVRNVQGPEGPLYLDGNLYFVGWISNTLSKWDGKSVTGTVNPGPNAIPIKSAVMDITPGKPAPEGRNSTTGIPPVFKVHLEFNAPGGPTVFEGTIQNPVAGNRRISGTWTRGAERGTFQLRHL